MRIDPIDVARLEEPRQALGVAEIARDARPLAGGWLCYGGEGSWQNQAVGLALGGAVGADELDALVAFYGERRVQPTIVVCPVADETLVAGLADRGFRLAGFENVLFRGLAADVESLAPVHGDPDGLVVRPLRSDDAREVDRFVEVSTCGFRPEGEPVPAPLDEGTRAMLAHPRFTGLVAELDGRMVGGSALEVAGELAALMATSVLPEARGRGVQQALMVARLRAARAHGARIATVQSKPGIPTERNARRLGFEVAYTRAELTRSGRPLD